MARKKDKMKIIFYVAGMPFDGNTIKEGNSLGGSESAGYYAAKELARRGNEVIVFSNIEKSMKADDVTYVPIGKPTEKHPFGEVFGNYASNVPSDVLIAQRVPGFFARKYNSKLNLWWTHDLALKRMQSGFDNQLPLLDGVLAVSEFHKEQINKVYGHKKELISVFPNGIDLSLFKDRPSEDDKINSKTMIYSSRPERGLENLVAPGGIMEKLYEFDPEIKLIVCGYNNTTEQMAPYYQELWGRCHQLPNVDLHGSLSKSNLASIMKGAWLHIYPTSFEETSCITVMEEQASGTPFVTTKTAALIETGQDAGIYWVDKTKEGQPDNQKFVDAVKRLSKKPEVWKKLHKKALDKSESYSIENAVDKLEETIDELFEKKTSSKARLVRHLIKNSDIIAAEKLIDKDPSGLEYYSDFIDERYNKVLNTEPKDFYDDVADYNTNQIKNHHNLGNDQFQLSMPRIKSLLNFLSEQKPGSLILDYGCCVGQQTVAYARAFPELTFIGCDIAQIQVDIANSYANEHKIENVRFLRVDTPCDLEYKFDAVMCSEVTEHIRDYEQFLIGLQDCAKENSEAKIAITVPYGPHEEVRWDSQSTREHLHHFEEQDIKDIFKQKDYNIVFTPSNTNMYGDVLGNFYIEWKKDDKPFEKIDYERKFKIQSPKETLSVCMICRTDGNSLAKTLESIKEISDEIIIGFDGEEGIGRGWDIAKDYGAKAFKIESPRVQGFDSARNETIAEAGSDWILWIDDDETMVWANQLYPFLRNNQYDSYAINQHHFSADPVGVMKTDLPCRVFRNNIGIKFFGFVHEHPETKMNSGAGETALLPHNIVAICHNGYENEEVRRSRFMRNWPLMLEDHKRNPERELGQFLFLRDLIHLNRFEWEQNGQQTTNEMVNRCNMVLQYYKELIKNNKVRLVVDSLPYITEATKMMSGNQGYSIDFSFRANHMGIGDDLNKPSNEIINGVFPNKELAMETLLLFADHKINNLSHKYI